MKIEKRGKYAGVKVHLEPEECEVFLKLASDVEMANSSIKAQETLSGVHPNHLLLSLKLGKKINQLIKDEPNLLKARTPEEIQAELENEYESAKLKLEAINKGKDWKEIHVK